MAAGDGKAGAVPTFSFTASEAGTNGTIPELETESANGAITGEELPLAVVRVCGDLRNKIKTHKIIACMHTYALKCLFRKYKNISIK